MIRPLPLLLLAPMVMASAPAPSVPPPAAPSPDQRAPAPVGGPEDMASEVRAALDRADPDDAADTLERWLTDAVEPSPLPALLYETAHALASAATEESTADPRAEAFFDAAARLAALRPGASSEDQRLARDAAMNLGRVRFVRAVAQPEADALAEAVSAGTSDPIAQEMAAVRSAMARLGEAERAYRAALDLDPSETDAARNIEIVRRAIAERRERLQELREEQRQREEARRDAAEALQQAADQQQQAADEQGSPEARREAQRRANESTERAEAQTPERDPALEEARERLEEARAAQQQAEEAMERGDEQQTRDAQQRAADALQEAAEAARRAAQPDRREGEEGEPRDPEQGEPSGQPRESEAGEPTDPTDAVAQALLNQERRRREAEAERQARLRTGGVVPVERDW